MFTPQPGTVFHSPGINSPQPPSSGDTLKLSCSLAQAPTPVENAADFSGAIQVGPYITLQPTITFHNWLTTNV